MMSRMKVARPIETMTTKTMPWTRIVVGAADPLVEHGADPRIAEDDLDEHRARDDWPEGEGERRDLRQQGVADRVA